MIVASHSKGEVDVPMTLLETVPACVLALLYVEKDGDLGHQARSNSDSKLIPKKFRLMIVAK